MAAIATSLLYSSTIGYPLRTLGRFLVLGNRHHDAENKTESVYVDLGDYEEAKTTAIVLAGKGFGCVVMDLDNRIQLYEMNKYMLNAHVQGFKPFPKDNEEADKWERSRIVSDVLRDREHRGEPNNFPTNTAMREMLEQAPPLGFPRRSGQTPQDCAQDWPDYPPKQ